MIQLYPLGHRVLIDPVINKKTTDWGFEFTDNDIKRNRLEISEGVVIAIGKQAWKDFSDGERWCEVGDRVIYAKYGGKLINHPEEPDKVYVILNDEDILCLVGE